MREMGPGEMGPGEMGLDDARAWRVLGVDELWVQLAGDRRVLVLTRGVRWSIRTCLT